MHLIFIGRNFIMYIYWNTSLKMHNKKDVHSIPLLIGKIKLNSIDMRS